jgi:beta-glucosidase-like glycosyl hydrolase
VPLPNTSTKQGVHTVAAKKQNDQQEPKEKKSDAVRRVFNTMKASGTEPKPVEIQRKLADEGIEVAAAQISQVVKRLREGTPTKGKKEHLFSLNDLIAARKFIGKIGSPDKAKELIDALGAG